MQAFATLHRFGALCVIVLCLLSGRTGLQAQPTSPPAAPSNPAKPEELSQTEMLESYRHLREQLHLTQAAILKNRLETEATVMAQSAAFAEKLDTIKSLMADENRRQQALADRVEYERTQQQLEMKQSHETVLWIAGAFGGLGLLAMVFAARLQWRTIRRLTEAEEMRLQLPAPSQSNLTLTGPDAPSDQTVTLANQRMMSVITRMERRIHELENSAHPLPTASHEPVGATKKAMA